MMFGMFLLGAFTFPMYALSSSHMNDQLRPEQVLSASSGLILLNGAGGVIGPLVASVIMDLVHINALFIFIALMNLSVAVFAIHRMRVKAPMVVEEQGDHVHVGLTVTPVVAAEMLAEADPNTPSASDNNEVEIKL